MTRVDFYLDFVSPYSYLALEAAPEFADANEVEWRLHPIVYGVLLDRHGLVGPVETDAKRAYTFEDVLRAAALQGLRIVGPPAHPFRSLAALRLLAACRDDPRALPLALELARAAWAQGRDLTDIATLDDAARRVGLDLDVPATVHADGVKLTLREETARALTAGVFGVPTFELDGELFWGHDRLAHLAARLQGRLPAFGPEHLESMLARPRGADRRAVRARRSSSEGT